MDNREKGNKEIITFNVGGQIFKTTKGTISRHEKDNDKESHLCKAKDLQLFSKIGRYLFQANCPSFYNQNFE